MADGVVEFWDFVLREPYGPGLGGLWNDGRVRLNWFVPPLSQNSGGHINIFRFALGLQARNFDVNIVICNDGMPHRCTKSKAELRRNIDEWYGQFDGSVFHDSDDLPPCHFAFATGWQTANAVRAFRGGLYKFYFVQDFEPYFYPMGSEHLFSENTYRMGFTGVTAGGWLSEKLSREYGMRTHAVGFSYDRALYQQKPRTSQNRNLFCYVRPETARRAWELTALTLAKFHEHRPDVGIVLAGGVVDLERLPFPAVNAGALRQTELPDLYSQCDAALVLSLTNLSLLPLELMACGVPVVSNNGPNVEWLLNSDVAKVVVPDPRVMAEALIEIFNLSEMDHRALSVKSKAFAHSTSWDSEFDKFAKILNTAIGRTNV